MSKSNGFTLSELLVVVVILGILLTLCAPAATAVRRQSTLAVSSSALRQLSIAAQNFLAENQGRFFRALERSSEGDQWWFGMEPGTGRRIEGKRVLDKSRGPLGPYIADSAGRVPDYAFTSMGASFKPKYANGYFGFGVNAELTGGPEGRDLSKLRLAAELDRPGRIALFATCAQVNTFQAPASARRPMLEEFYFFNTTDCRNTVHFRHGQKALVAFADGSQQEVQGDPSTFDRRLRGAAVGSLPPSMIVPGK